MTWDHGEICPDCWMRAGIHDPREGGVSLLGQSRYEASCSCGWRSTTRSSGREALVLLEDHVEAIEACGCLCHAGTHWPRSLGDRGEDPPGP